MHSYAEDFDSCATAFPVVVSSLPQPMLSLNAHYEPDPNTGSPLFDMRLGIPDGSFATFLTHIVDQVTSLRDHSVQITSIASCLSDLILRVSHARSADREFLLGVLNHRPLFEYLTSLLKDPELVRMGSGWPFGPTPVGTVLKVIYECTASVWIGFRQEIVSYLMTLNCADIFGALEVVFLQYGNLRHDEACESLSLLMRDLN